MSRHLVRLVLVSIGVTWGATAEAIPRFAVRFGTTCSTCHVNPSGGGMRNRFGRNVVIPTRLPMRWSGGRSLSPLLDADLTDTVAVGTDARAASFLQVLPDSPLPTTFTFMLMQADAYLSAGAGQALTFYLDAGFYGSSEAMLLLHLPAGLYLKAGRFMPSFGLRLENHTVSTRQDIGFGPTQKDVGIELGWQQGRWHLQASVLNGNPDAKALLDENWQKALVGRAEYLRPGRHVNFMAGASGWWNVQGVNVETQGVTTDTRAGDLRWGGFVGASLGRLVYLAEADVAQKRLFSEYKWTRTYVSYQELDVLLARGVELNLNWEYEDPDLRYRDNAFQRGLVGFEIFPRPNLELKVYYKRTFGPDSNPLSGLNEAFAMLHFFL